VVGEDDVGASAMDARQDFEHRAALVQPTLCGGGFDHGVFPTHVVRPYRNVEFLADASDDIEIWQRGLDHDHVCAFFNIERDFSQRFARVGVPLAEVDVRTMESKRCPRLFLVGEILDVDGRIGGFNFQWAWATGFIAGQALATGKTAAR